MPRIGLNEHFAGRSRERQIKPARRDPRCPTDDPISKRPRPIVPRPIAFRVPRSADRVRRRLRHQAASHGHAPPYAMRITMRKSRISTCDMKVVISCSSKTVASVPSRAPKGPRVIRPRQRGAVRNPAVAVEGRRHT